MEPSSPAPQTPPPAPSTATGSASAAPAFDPRKPWDSVTLAVSGFGGDQAIGVVLHDWFTFLGGRPAEVVYVDGGSGASTVRVLTSLVRRGVIDRLELLNPRSWENSFHRCYIQEHEAGILARNPYIIFVKPDVLPLRRGHEGWLARDIAQLDAPGVFAVTMSHLIDPAKGARGEFDVHDFASLNFSLMKRSAFREAMDSQIGAFIAGGFRGEFPAHIQCEERYRRALIEWAWQEHCRARGLVTLARRESMEWMIFHINKSGRKLLSLRDKMRAGDDVQRHFDQPKNLYRPAPRGLSRAGRGIEGVLRGIRKTLRG